MNQDFINLLDEMKEIHERKSHDYAKESDSYSNFRESATIAGVDVPTSFFVLIGTKISRLRNLIASGKNAKNESLIDSAKDLTVYCALLTSFLVKEERDLRDVERNFGPDTMYTIPPDTQKHLDSIDKGIKSTLYREDDDVPF